MFLERVFVLTNGQKKKRKKREKESWRKKFSEECRWEREVAAEEVKLKRRWFSDRIDRKFAKMLRVLRGVARGLHSGKTVARQRMAAPGEAGNGLAVQHGHWSHRCSRNSNTGNSS